MVSFNDGTWAVVDPEGRFDTNNLEEIRGLHWIFPDDPFRPLSPETFMRDYYEPRLLPRAFAREPFKPVRPLSELNRVQPSVRISSVTHGGESGVAQVTVEVAAAEGRFGRESGGRLFRTGVYDVRLFRDGQLVGRWPEPADGDDAKPEPDPTNPEDMVAWQDANRVRLDALGKATRTFPVRLPRRRAQRWSLRRTRSTRIGSRAPPPPPRTRFPGGVPEAKPRAYVVAFGAAGFSDPAWDLSFAAADARLAATRAGQAARCGRADYEVVPILLATDRGAAGASARPGEATATAAHLKAVLDRLAGRPVDMASPGRHPGL